MTKQRYVRFWNWRSMVSLIGIDYRILEKSENDNLPKFYLAGFLIIGILAISFLAVFYAFDLMFDMWHAEILLSSFFSLMFCTIYVFLLQTFSKEVFPTSVKFRFFNLSNLSRVGFVLMIGFLMAQPVKIFLLRNSLDKDIAVYKTHLNQKFRAINSELYADDIRKLLNDKVKYQLMPKSEILDGEIKKIDIILIKITTQANQANLKAQKTISSSNFFIKRIEIASKYPKSNSIVFCILSLFIAPILLIYSISGSSKYYVLKRKNDKELVETEYSIFKYQYTSLFEKKYQLKDIHFHEPFLDPPFNTKRKALPNYLSQEDFFNNLIE